MKIPTEKPVLPGYIVDPDKPTSVENLKDALVEYQMWVLVTEYAKEKRLSYEDYVDSLTKEEMFVLRERAIDAALSHADLINSLAERTTFRIAYDVLQRSIHRTVGEVDDIEAYLLEKLENTNSKASISEVTFLLELIQSNEAQGGEYTKGIFSNRGAYGRLVEAIPVLRKKHYRATAVEIAEKKQLKDLTERANRAKRELETAEDDEIHEVQAEIQDIEEEIDEVRAIAVEEKEKAQKDLAVTMKAAFDVASTKVPRKEVKETVEKLAKKYLEDAGEDPKEISKDYGEPEEPKRPIAYAVHETKAVIFIMAVQPQFANVVTRLLETTFDVHMAERDEALDMLKGE